LGKGLDGATGTSLNTRGVETPEQRAYRHRLLNHKELKDLFGDGEVAPATLDTAEIFVEELYSPMMDAKCFNDHYNPPSVNND